MGLLYAPLPGRYAIIRINAVATVEHFQYPDILAAAEAMSTRKYLIYIEQVSTPDTLEPSLLHLQLGGGSYIASRIARNCHFHFLMIPGTLAGSS